MQKTVKIIFFIFFFLSIWFVKPSRVYAQPVRLEWGSICQFGNTNQRCRPPTECRTSSGGVTRCLKNSEQISDGGECEDSSECVGFSEEAFCGFGICNGDPSNNPPPAGGGTQPLPPANEYICEDRGINTPFGCIDITGQNQLIIDIIRVGASLAGGIALLLIIWASYTIITSTGDPYRLRGGKELLTAAISGVMLLIFSVFLLNQIGVQILGIF